MANFSSKERMMADILSALPGVKKIVKRIYILLNAQIYRKPYSQRCINGYGPINFVEKDDSKESFFGYYDKNCERNGKVIYHRTKSQPTNKKPDSRVAIEIILKDINTGEEAIIANTYTYNWQQGARLQWVDDSRIIFNTLEENRYKALVYSLNDGGTEKYDYPVQEVLPDGRYLSIDYSRIMKLRSDYGYRNLPVPSEKEMNNLSVDGIFIVNPVSRESRLLHSLDEIAKVEPKDIFSKCAHVVNHLMACPSGDGFIFIHRFYEGARRHDRLMYSDFRSLKVLADDDMVSHCCWLDEDTILGYLRHHGENGFFEINVNTGEFKANKQMSIINFGDGHPSVSERYVAFDTYPDKSRMQHLFLMDRSTGKVSEIAELKHSVKFMDECRCDLHPRFSTDGNRLYFDTVSSGKRQLAYIDILKKD